MVVDIFSSKGSRMPFSRMLPDVLEELGVFALHFVFLCGILFLVKRFRSRLLALSAAFLMPFFQLFFVWKVSIHSEVFLSVALAFLLTVQIRLLDLIPFHTEDLLFLFAAFLFPARLFNSTSVLLGHLWLFWLIFCTYHTAVRLSLHSLRGTSFSAISRLWSCLFPPMDFSWPSILPFPFSRRPLETMRWRLSPSQGCICFWGQELSGFCDIVWGMPWKG